MYALNHCRMACEGKFYVFYGECIATKETYSVKVPIVEYHNYVKGAYIQDALKSVSAEDREFLLSGLSPKGWKLTFKESEDE